MADFLSESIEFHEGLCACGLGHPGQLLEPILEYGFQVLDQFEHASAGGGRKMFLDEKLAEGFADLGINHPSGALPARFLDLLFAEHFAVKLEIFVLNGRMQVWRRRMDQVPPQ